MAYVVPNELATRPESLPNTASQEPFRRRDAFGLVGVVAGVVLIILGVPENGTPLNAAVLVDSVYSNPVAYGYLIFLSCTVLFFMFCLEPR
jgi:hypothetical protein